MKEHQRVTQFHMMCWLKGTQFYLRSQRKKNDREKNFRSDSSVYGIVYGDGFTGVCLSSDSSRCIY